MRKKIRLGWLYRWVSSPKNAQENRLCVGCIRIFELFVFSLMILFTSSYVRHCWGSLNNVLTLWHLVCLLLLVHTNVCEVLFFPYSLYIGNMPVLPMLDRLVCRQKTKKPFFFIGSFLILFFLFAHETPDKRNKNQKYQKTETVWNALTIIEFGSVACSIETLK